MTEKQNNSPKTYQSATINKLPHSEVEIIASIPSEIWEKHRAEAIKHINETVTIDGFRKGNVPENILISKVGESAILEEAAELAISAAYFNIVVDNKIDAIGKPSVSITKLAKGNPLEFKIVTAIVPEFTLPDCKKLAGAEVKKSSPKELEVTDSDVEETILKIRKSRSPKNKENHEHTHEDGEVHEHKETEGKADSKKQSPEEVEKELLDSLPEFNDEFVRGLGDFKDVADFKVKIREMIGQSKNEQAQEKLRLRISDALIENTKIELPKLLVETELNRTQSQFETDIERMGVKLDDYLKHAKKTIEEIREEWKPHAEKKAALQLILNKISAENNIVATPQEIEAEVNHIVEHYKDADRERAAVYAETILTNEKVFQWLESQETK